MTRVTQKPHSERNPEHTWERYLELMDENQRLEEQLEASRQATQKWYDEAHAQRTAINRALHELDQWVFADGTASYRVERAEEILRGVSSPASEPQPVDAPTQGDDASTGGEPR